MEKTKDYSIFKIMKSGNRKVDERHVKRLVEVVAKENLLHTKPIIVNKKMEVLDGQHRLEVAKILNVPIYYNIVEDMTPLQVAVVNTHQKNWVCGDYLDLFSDGMKLPEYVKLKNLAKDKDLSNTEVVAFFYGNSFSKFRNDFNSGNFIFDADVIPVVDCWKLFLDKIKLFYHNSQEIWHTQSFIRAFTFVLGNKEIVHERFLEQLDRYGFIINRRGGYKEYIEMLVELYNYKKRNPVEL